MSRTIRGSLIAALLVPFLSAQPISLYPTNPHYFQFGGKAVALIASGEHYGAVLNAGVDYRSYLAALEADGLNYTRLFGGSYVEVPGQSFGILRNDLAPAPGQYMAPWARSQMPGYAGGNKFDLERWSNGYFDRLHAFLSEAEKRGIVVEITLFSSQYGEAQWKVSPFNGANNVNGTDAINWRNAETLENGNLLRYQEQYTRKIVREANGFDNVLFEIQNEPWSDQPTMVDVINPYIQGPARDKYPNSVEVADTASMAWQERVAEWIRSEEARLPKKHLIAENYCNFRFPVRNLVPGIGVVNFHYAYPEAVLWNYGLGKAIAYDETGFLGRKDDAYLRQAWNFMLSGGSTFDNLDYSFTPGHADGTDTAPNGPGGGSPALRHQLGILSKFLKALPLADLHPDLDTVKHAAGAKAHLLSDEEKHEYAMYLDASGPVEVTLSLPKGRYSGEWLNPATGSTQKVQSFRHEGGVMVLRAPDLQDGLALKLTRADGD